MTDTNPAKFNKLVTLLKELFQLDQPDLDFGIYRILHARADEVTQFLEADLLPQVKEAFAGYQSADSAELKRRLEQMVAQLTEAGVDPEQAPRVQELREQLKGAVDLGALENEVYDHLYSFFRRYYSEGDFLAKRVYKPGVYAIPYEGEEVTLHWANRDQYYIKTSEYLRDYAFRLKPDAKEGEDPMRVRFKLVDAAEGEHGNVKAAEGKDRVFVLAAGDFIAEVDGELELRFEYRPATLGDWPADQRDGRKKPPAQKDLRGFAVVSILAADGEFANWLTELRKTHVKANGEQADYNVIHAKIEHYTKRNTFDYFIHKDLDGFLRRELDFYIKNEVMHLDDVESETAPRVEQYLSKIKVIRRIAGKIIDFLAQLENFQKKLWLKKKFVIASDWLVAISQIPDELLPEVCANAAQLEEWKALHSLHELPAGLTRPAYSEPLTPEYLRVHPSLMVDTRHFAAGFVAKLLENASALDETVDGVLLHGDNFHALSLAQKRYQSKVHCTYIDPPYNAPKSEIAYKNDYKHSSFLSLMEGRLQLSRNLSAEDGSHVVAIDKHEQNGLFRLVNQIFPFNDNVSVTIEHNRKGVQDAHFSYTNEYALFSIPSARKTLNRTVRDEAEWEWSNFRNWGGESLRTDAANCFYAVLVQDNEIVGFGEVWTDESQHPSGANVRRPDGVIEVYPIDGTGVERKWRYERGTVEAIKCRLKVDSARDGDLQIKIAKVSDQFKTVWYSPRYNAGDNGTKLVREMGVPIGEFDYPKSLFNTRDCIFSVSDKGALVLDYFAGSGTTGHAVIHLNREDGGRRRFILAEQGGYFDSVLLCRLKKAAFAPDWKDGKPQRLATQDEAEHSPRLIKVLRLESYEDTLNNLALSRSTQQQAALDFGAAQGTDGLREQYLLRYQLDVESHGSASLLNIAAFTQPTAYKLLVKTPGSDESREVNVDLLETFNWLLGLTVQHIAAPRSFAAGFERDGEGRLRINGRLKQDAAGPWWFRTVTGTTPEGRKTLVIWRKLTGDAEQDNLVLETWFRDKQAFSVRDAEFDLIYVNGDNGLENIRLEDESWKVRLTEEDFQRLMFEGTD
ncbi:site-specific DNA-methyltransferase [Luteimonas lutimaris]|uniref:DNA methylase N-4/N-6 domain-containing protein n=1 Tax=Luteimonas lutimaris TaxID=698645 RepID=A0ABP7M330_9GAMM